MSIKMWKWLSVSFSALATLAAVAAENPQVPAGCVALSSKIPLKGSNANLNESHLTAGRIPTATLESMVNQDLIRERNPADDIENEFSLDPDEDGIITSGKVEMGTAVAGANNKTLAQNTERTSIQLSISPTTYADDSGDQKANFSGFITLTPAQVDAIKMDPLYLGKPEPKICGVGLHLDLASDGKRLKGGAVILYLNSLDHPFGIEAQFDSRDPKQKDFALSLQPFSGTANKKAAGNSRVL